MMRLGVIDANDQLIEADLGGTVFHIGLHWNQEGQLWTLSVRDLDRQILVSGIAVVPNWPLLRQIRAPELPPGEFGVSLRPGAGLDRGAFVRGDASLWYFPPEELA